MDNTDYFFIKLIVGKFKICDNLRYPCHLRSISIRQPLVFSMSEI
jgi:hypothetical protein